jgi:uncharacterized protein
MSKPDPTGGSLESILASIRQGLSEQSPDALGDSAKATADRDQDVKPSRKPGLAQRLAGASAETSPPRAAQSANDDLSDLLEEPAGKAVPVVKAAVNPSSSPIPSSVPAKEPEAVSGDKDPLWFLTKSDEPAPEVEAVPAAPAPATTATSSPAAEPKLTRPEVLRASMPPFFGASEEAAKVAAGVVDPATTPSGTAKLAPQASPAPSAPPAPASAEAIAREVSLVAAATEAATRASQPTAAQPAPAQPVLNGKGPAAPEPLTGAVLAGDTPHNRALEAMVLDLLKPMLSQWLDQNMPRLVAEALAEEVQRARAAKKT